MECRKAVSKTDIEFCKEAILAFWPNLDPQTVVAQVFRMITQEGYQLVFLPDADSKKAGAFIGYRKQTMLRTGPMIYIDDLFTFPECRNQGFASALLDHVTQYASEEGVTSVHLDSGYSLHTAHRLYLNKGYYLACNHFAKVLN